MVDSWYCLDRFVPEGISQISKRSEVRNTKRRSLNTRLSSGISVGTFAVSAGPYRNYHAKAGTENEPWHVFGTISKKGLENRSSRFEPKNSWLSFSRGSGPPLNFTTSPTILAFVSKWGNPPFQTLRSPHPPSHSKFTPFCLEDLVQYMSPVRIPGLFCVRGMFKIFVGKNCRICQLYWCFHHFLPVHILQVSFRQYRPLAASQVTRRKDREVLHKFAQPWIIHMPIFWCLVDPPETCSFVGLIKPFHLLTGLFWDAVDSFAGFFDGFTTYAPVKVPVKLTNWTIVARWKS